MHDAATTAAGGLVGRARELDAIAAAVGGLAEGRGQTVFLTGEPGIGKSTLARATAAEAARRNVPVFWGYAWESGGAPAYWPWTQALSELIRRLDPDPELARNVERILPQSGEPVGVTLNPDQARFRLLEAVRALLSEVSNRSPLVLIFEDLHAADGDTLQMLQFVARHVHNMRILLCGTFRDADARSAESTAPLWQSLRDARVLSLARLTRAEVRDYLTRRGHESPPDHLVDVLQRTTSGNPLFVAELTDILAHEGSLDAEDLRLPESIQQVIRQQVGILPRETGVALTQAAVLGRRFSVDALAELTDADVGPLAAILEPAVDSEVVRRTADERLVFTHVLFRDVLYRSMERAEREELHLRRARQLRKILDADSADRWAELATHLTAAGNEQRLEAAGAWREAGRRAQDRLAYDEAVKLYERALEVFGEGPRFSPDERCRILLELAGAMLTQGDVTGGQRRCREAFDIAVALRRPALMAEAALTWGSVFVIAKVDRELVAMLEESLAQLDTDDSAARARVAARLAAAQQPAPNPREPMQMARDAIALARTTGDERVIYDVLKSAVSALMDFAPVDEVMALNREFSELARKYRNVPDQFRSYLRLTMAASELGDRRLMDEYIERCGRVAERIGLPHYQWRVASARAMQAMLEGRFSQAKALIEDAERLADAASDIGAGITLPIQRFGILYEWDSAEATPIDVIEKQLSAAFSMLPDAETYARPMFASFACRSGTTNAGESIMDREIAERLFAGNDRFCVSRLAEVAINDGDLELAERCFDALLPHRDHCSTMGLMGTSWGGPVAYTLGTIAVAAGRLEDAAEFFGTALEIAKRMRAQPAIARIHESLAELEARRGDQAGAREHAAVAERLIGSLGLCRVRGATGLLADGGAALQAAADRFSMRRDGDVWHAEFDGEKALVRNAKGLRMLAALVAEPDTDKHVLDLSGDGAVPAADAGDAGPVLDAQARDEYRRRVAELEEALAEAAETADLGRADTLREELDFITRELSRAFGIGGRARRSSSAAERARVNVRRRLKDAIERIGTQLPAAGRYLGNTIHTGSYCRYSPI